LDPNLGKDLYQRIILWLRRYNQDHPGILNDPNRMKHFTHLGTNDIIRQILDDLIPIRNNEINPNNENPQNEPEINPEPEPISGQNDPFSQPYNPQHPQFRIRMNINEDETDENRTWYNRLGNFYNAIGYIAKYFGWSITFNDMFYLALQAFQDLAMETLTNFFLSVLGIQGFKYQTWEFSPDLGRFIDFISGMHSYYTYFRDIFNKENAEQFRSNIENDRENIIIPEPEIENEIERDIENEKYIDQENKPILNNDEIDLDEIIEPDNEMEIEQEIEYEKIIEQQIDPAKENNEQETDSYGNPLQTLRTKKNNIQIQLQTRNRNPFARFTDPNDPLNPQNYNDYMGRHGHRKIEDYFKKLENNTQNPPNNTNITEWENPKNQTNVTNSQNTPNITNSTELEHPKNQPNRTNLTNNEQKIMNQTEIKFNQTDWDCIEYKYKKWLPEFIYTLTWKTKIKNDTVYINGTEKFYDFINNLKYIMAPNRLPRQTINTIWEGWKWKEELLDEPLIMIYNALTREVEKKPENSKILNAFNYLLKIVKFKGNITYDEKILTEYSEEFYKWFQNYNWTDWTNDKYNITKEIQYKENETIWYAPWKTVPVTRYKNITETIYEPNYIKKGIVGTLGFLIKIFHYGSKVIDTIIDRAIETYCNWLGIDPYLHKYFLAITIFYSLGLMSMPFYRHARYGKNKARYLAGWLQAGVIGFGLTFYDKYFNQTAIEEFIESEKTGIYYRSENIRKYIKDKKYNITHGIPVLTDKKEIQEHYIYNKELYNNTNY